MTAGLFASDIKFGDTIGNDSIPEMAVGRLPVLTSEELDALIDKIIGYETFSSNEDWVKNVLMIADNAELEEDFPSDSDEIAEVVPDDYLVEKVYLIDSQPANVALARQSLLGKIDEGVFLTNYIGHGGLDRFTEEGLLVSADVDGFLNEDRLPLFIAMTCVVGRFELPGYDCLSETLLLKAEGGAAAVWAPIGFSLNAEARTMDKMFFNSIFSAKENILGDAVVKSLQSYISQGGLPFMAETYNILGDPALKLKGRQSTQLIDEGQKTLDLNGDSDS